MVAMGKQHRFVVIALATASLTVVTGVSTVSSAQTPSSSARALSLSPPIAAPARHRRPRPRPTTTIAPPTLAPTTTIAASTTTAPTTTPAPTTTAAPTTTTAPTTTAPTTTAPTTTAPTTTTVPANGIGGERWVRIEGNLLVDNVDSIMPTVNQAKAAGANTIFFADTKVNLWFASGFKDTWRTKAQDLRDRVRNLGMKFVFQTTPVGYCTPLLFHDPNLTTGYPMVNQPLQVRGGKLVPIETAQVVNGSFETSTDNRPAGWGFQDLPGQATFIDKSVAKQGSSSFRVTYSASNSNQQGRIFGTASVQPQQQYALRFWVKTQGLTAGFLGPVVQSPDGKRRLTSQHYSVAAGAGRNYISSPDNWTTDWVEMVIPFNSGDQRDVNIAFGAWSHRAGTLWVDDVRIESVPTLNVVRRGSLPLSLTSNGRRLTEGVDVAAIVDPLLGQVNYPGYIETYHQAPSISVPGGSSLKEGDTVLLTGYHAQVTMSGQAGCTWQDPAIFALMKRVHEEAAAIDLADGYVVDLEEVRTGGWEPADAQFGTSGASLGAHAARVFADARVATGKPIYTWGDMLTPAQNAVADFYQVKGTLNGTWTKVPSSSAIVLNWADILETAPPAKESVDHFAALGFSQLIAAYYDRSPAENYAYWQSSLVGKPRIIGSMYTTWLSDYSQLTAFAALWWK
jgi:hypothetical protein